MIETAITAIYDEMPAKYKGKIKRVYILIVTCFVLFLFGLVFTLRVKEYIFIKYARFSKR